MEEVNETKVPPQITDDEQRAEENIGGTIRREGGGMNTMRRASLHQQAVGNRRDHLQRLCTEKDLQDSIVNRSLTAKNFADAFMAEDEIRDVEDPHVESRQIQSSEERKVQEVSGRIREVLQLLDEYKSVSWNSKSVPVEVRLDDLTYTVFISQNEKVKTVFNASCFYSIFKAYKRYVKREVQVRQELTPKKVLDRINLVLKPGKMYLLLGPPRSGKSTLLRAISSRLHASDEDLVEGTVTYNGRVMKEKDEFFFENAVAYIDQLDKHAPRLTVEETFEFAFQCKAGGKFSHDDTCDQSEAAKALLKHARETKLYTRILLASLGLTEVKDTFVGDTNVRGVSGGQRRRVTVGEMLMPGCPVVCGDEISTGLDSASTFDMIQLVLHFGRMANLTRIISLLQPSPETVSLFDELILLGEGQVIYCGPVTDVENYFASIGYKAPDFMDSADFLQLICTEEGASLYKPDDDQQASRPDAPTLNELAQIFRDSECGARIKYMLATPPSYIWKKGADTGGSVVDPNRIESFTKQYANSFVRSTVLITQRFVKLWIRDMRVVVVGALKNVVMGISVGGVFFNTKDPISIQGALFQAGLFVMLGAMQNSLGLVNDRIIFKKHAYANFYSVWPFVLGRTIAQLPQMIIDTLMFGIILYYELGLAGRNSFGNLVTFLSLLFLFTVLMVQQLSLFAAFASASSAQGYCACVIMLNMLFGGFIIAPSTIPEYYRWIYWLNPFAWVYRSLLVLEFRSARWENPDDILTGLGFVDGSGVPFSSVWIRYGFIFGICYALMCFVSTAVALSVSRALEMAAARGPASAGPVETKSELDDFAEISYQPVQLSFHDLCYEVKASTRSEKLKLLSNVNGIFRPGRMCALMGTSGAGKTTLMDVIALRKRSGDITGEILVNGWAQDPESFRRCTGYVEQFDVQSPQLTVKETIAFSARLRLESSTVPAHSVDAFVDRVMRDVELDGLSTTLVGTDETGGLTFEQKKRLSIAVELAASPSVLFLDEPTSGLDARSSLLVVKTLRVIANGGRTICATIHQPSSTVFGMFDDLLLLKRGGSVVYHGELGESCSSLISYFESKGAPMIEIGENPANWVLRVMAMEKLGDLARVYRESDNFKSIQDELKNAKDMRTTENQLHFESKYAVSGHTRRDVVNQRLTRIYWRSPTYCLTRLTVSALIAFILGSVFIYPWNPKVLTELEMRARLSAIFLSFIITGIMSILSVLPVMTWIRDMYYRHNDAGMYGSWAMGLALGVAEKWFILLSAFIFTVIFLSTSRIGPGIYFSLAFWGFFSFNLAIYSYIGQAFVCLVKPQATAFILASVFIGLNNIFSGLIVRPQFMVGTFFAFPFAITPGRYVYEGLIVSLYRIIDTEVQAQPGSDFFNYLVSRGDCAINQTDPCEGSDEQFIDIFFDGEFREDHIDRNALILGSVLLLVRLVTWWALEYVRFA